ncbi:Zinc finger protein [Plecturocebus cupreus]
MIGFPPCINTVRFAKVNGTWSQHIRDCVSAIIKINIRKLQVEFGERGSLALNRRILQLDFGRLEDIQFVRLNILSPCKIYIPENRIQTGECVFHERTPAENTFVRLGTPEILAPRWSLTLTPRRQITQAFSWLTATFHLPGSSDSLTSASQVAGITGACLRTRLIFVLVFVFVLSFKGKMKEVGGHLVEEGSVGEVKVWRAVWERSRRVVGEREELERPPSGPDFCGDGRRPDDDLESSLLLRTAALIVTGGHTRCRRLS